MGYILTPTSSLVHTQVLERALALGLRDPNAHRSGPGAAAGHGRTRPAIPRLSPRLATPVVAVLDGARLDG